MAFRPLLRQRAVVPATSAILAAGLALSSARHVHAESPENPLESALRKPIYDDFAAPAPPKDEPQQQPIKTQPSAQKPYAPTPTERLTEQVARGRLFLHGYAAAAEDKVNSGLTEALRLENSFTQTVASLAPPKESGERVMPGGLYVLVSAMAGSIVTRNRNILLRASVPVAVAVAASYALLPLTTRNVGNLIWTYEERYPALAENHMLIKDRVTRFIETGKAHSKMSVAMLEEKVGSARETVEEWVKKGK